MAKKQRVKIGTTKGASNAVLKYRELLKAGKIAASEAFEALSRFFTRRGTVKVRETRYNTGKQALNEAIERVRRETGSKSPSKKRIIEQAKREEKARKDKARFEKAKQTYTKNNTKDKRFKRVAREKASQYTKMVEVFASDAYNQLRAGEYGLGSDVVEQLAEQGLSDQDIIDYLEQIGNSLKMIPNEARQYTEKDDFWKSVIDISEMIKNGGMVDIEDVVYAYITVDADRENFEAALQNYMDSPRKTMSFSEAWAMVNDTLDPASPDNMTEVLESVAI